MRMSHTGEKGTGSSPMRRDAADGRVALDRNATDAVRSDSALAEFVSRNYHGVRIELRPMSYRPRMTRRERMLIHAAIIVGIPSLLALLGFITHMVGGIE